ncbi:glutamate-5-semialdehyde dehydrogenase [Cyanobacterium sp. uoEpiScrs1]|uniref:glutamate-5-semialdehyde dehydrogenase n=1 Tax=Cyanobacterium sp. uoEpiScrs1 TaxID=2976343 RepID=UPI0022699630|nr:glutamate-5-semialdehyde dehydrogenase [Cyanobacterium sp. uoEpiScrs1]
MVSNSIKASSLVEIARKTREAARQLGALSIDERNSAIEAIVQTLEDGISDIIRSNKADCEIAKNRGISKPLYNRLKLSETKLRTTIQGVRNIKMMPDPLGVTQIHRELDDGLILKRKTCPLGVLGVIFEARPEVLIQIISLAIKSGNGVILKGGIEAIKSCQTMFALIQKALLKTSVDHNSVKLLTTREEIRELLTLENDVDLIIPRGSNDFVRYVQHNTNIPVLGHADGICHLYVDKQADLNKAVAITVDSKTQYPAACNAIETLLVHHDIAPQFLPKIAQVLKKNNVELRGDKTCQKLINITPATEEDWKTEYSDLILSIKIETSLEDAIAHINTYGSKHTDAIITENKISAAKFLNQVDAAGVFHNCSTRFSDGFRYGFGAEVGISTQKIPPRGPVGLEGLITYKYQVAGDAHIVATYSGDNAKSFQYRDI